MKRRGPNGQSRALISEALKSGPKTAKELGAVAGIGRTSIPPITNAIGATYDRVTRTWSLSAPKNGQANGHASGMVVKLEPREDGTHVFIVSRLTLGKVREILQVIS